MESCLTALNPWPRCHKIIWVTVLIIKITQWWLLDFSPICSVAQSCLTLQPHGLQHARLPCPSPSPRVRSDSCPLSQWCHPTISSFVVPFSSCLQSFPASGSFLVSQLFTSGGQNICTPASATVLQMNIQGWFPLRLTGLISLLSKGLSRVFSSTTIQRHQFLPLLLLYCALSQNSEKHFFVCKEQWAWGYMPTFCPWQSLPLHFLTDPS